MSEKNRNVIRKAYDIAMVSLTLLLGLLFIFQTVSIYKTGLDRKAEAAEIAQKEAIENGLSEKETNIAIVAAKNAVKIYSREIVENKFLSLLPFTLIWVAVAASGIVLDVIWKRKDEKRRCSYPHLSEELLERKLPGSSDESNKSEFSEALASRKSLKFTSNLYLGVTIGLCTVLALFPLLYLNDFSHFPAENITDEVLDMFLFMLPFLVAMVFDAIVYVIHRDKLLVKMISADKELIRLGDPSTVQKKNKKGIWTLSVRIALLGAGIILTVIGCLNGSMKEVFMKASNICMECIGLG